MVTFLNRQTGWDSRYTKYRVSDNNNADASGFHRDIFAQKNIKLPCYTFLHYFDETIMEVIPGSHNQLFVPVSKLVPTLQKSVRVTIRPGDLLIFDATLLHRGIFFVNLKSRKLIQVFELFPTNKDQLQWSDKIHHVKSGNKVVYDDFLFKIGEKQMVLQIVEWHSVCKLGSWLWHLA
jgi:cell wall-associated NlpC family hydrolase